MATTTSWGNRSWSANGIAGEPLRVGDQDVGTGEQRVESSSGRLRARTAGRFDDRAMAEVEELEQRAATVGGVGSAPDQ